MPDSLRAGRRGGDRAVEAGEGVAESVEECGYVEGGGGGGGGGGEWIWEWKGEMEEVEVEVGGVGGDAVGEL